MIDTPDIKRLTSAVETLEAATGRGCISSGAVANLKRWLTEPQYGKYVPSLLDRIEGNRFEELEDLFWEVIAFGTGGRRGVMGEFGSATINERTIAESAHGLAAYLKQVKPGPGRRAVVARDTRNRSMEFARLTASTFAAYGLKVFFFELHRATPELSFAVRQLDCDVGVMISASHNPPSDNGFKAYWSNGGQILAPNDRGIIDCVYRAGEIPAVDFDEAVANGSIEFIGDEVDRAYISAVTALSLSPAREMPALYTPLHGVGETSVYRVLTQAGFSDVEIFGPQRAPDGNFPNVPDQLPNPERTAVFEPAVARARETGAELILASDPDADRLGAAVQTPNGEFVPLSGNRIGVLLADYILRKHREAGTLSAEHYVVETMVTTPLIAAVARSYGVRVIDDLLVGFKYIGETIDAEGPDRFLFGAEESLGYLAGQYCRDKDAAIAALYLMELAAELRQDGKTLLDRLDELFEQHGYFVETQRSEVCAGARGQEQIEELMRKFRSEPPSEPAGVALDRVRDYGRHETRSLPENEKIEDLPAPDGNVLFFESTGAAGRFSFAVRPSGTENKIKIYFFARSDPLERVALASLKERTEQALTAFENAVSNWVQAVLAS